MFFENLKKIRQLKVFLKNPASIEKRPSNSFTLVQARSKLKAKQYQEAFNLYLDILMQDIEAPASYLFKDLLICLLHLQDLHDDLCVPIAIYLIDKQALESPILLQIMQKLYLQQAPQDSLKLYQLYFEKNEDAPPFEGLQFQLMKTLIALNKNEEALDLFKHNKFSKTAFQVEARLQRYQLHIQMGEQTTACEKIQKIYQEFPEHLEVIFSYAKHHLMFESKEIAEKLFFELTQKPNCSIEAVQYFIFYLMKQNRPIEALRIARQYQEQSSSITNQNTMQLIIAWNQETFLEGYRLFEDLLTKHGNVLLVLQAMMQFATKHQEGAIVLELKEKIHEIFTQLGEEMPPNFGFLHLLENQIQLKLPNHEIRRVQIPEPIAHLIQEVGCDNHAHEEIYLVGGAVLLLLKNLDVTTNCDVDLIYVSNKSDINHYVPSRYLPNLFIRNTRALGGHSVDLMKIPLAGLKKSFLEENACLRDFTICAIYCDPQGVLHDPTGRGLQDFELKRLDTILDAKVTLLDDPVRIIRAFKYISRGFKPSHALEEALLNLPPISLNYNIRFNQALLKECNSRTNLDFIRTLQKYNFLKQLTYCKISSEMKDPSLICSALIKQLYILKLSHQSLYSQPLTHPTTKLQSNQEEMLSQKIKHLKQDLELKSQLSQKLNEQREELQLDISHASQELDVLQEDVAQLSSQVHQRQKQLSDLKIQELQYREKQHKIECLRKKLLEKQQNIHAMKQSVHQLESNIQKKVEEIYDQKNEKNFHARSIRFHQTQEMLQSKYNISSISAATQKKTQKSKERFHSNQEVLAVTQQKNTTYQRTLNHILKHLENHFQNQKSDGVIDEGNYDLEFPRFYFDNLHALEQMVRVVSNPELRAFLHAHIVLKELSLPSDSQNAFKICNHIQSFLTFLPLHLKAHFQDTMNQLLQKHKVDIAENNYQKVFVMGEEAKQKMEIEKAIYYYHIALELYAERSRKVYYDAILALADIHLRNHDILALDLIITSLQRNRDLPNTVSNRIKLLQQQLIEDVQQIESINKRLETQFGFQDFWLINVLKSGKILKHSHHLIFDHKMRNTIFYHITEKTISADEYLLALIEYAFCLQEEKSNELAQLQWQQIQHFTDENPRIEILKTFAKNQSIPLSLKEAFDNFTPHTTPYVPENSFEAQELETLKEQLPHDEPTLVFLLQHCQHTTVKALLSYLIASKKLENQKVMPALQYLEKSLQDSYLHPYCYRQIQTIHQQHPQIHWDSCDALGWHELGLDYKEKNQIEIALYCFHHSTRINNKFIKSIFAIFEIYYEQKNIRELVSIKLILQECINHWIELKNKKILNPFQVSDLSSLLLRFQGLVHNVIESHNKRLGIYQDLINHYSLLNPFELDYFDKIDLKKERLISSLCWSLYKNQNREAFADFEVLEYALLCNHSKKNEYLFTHLELAINHLLEGQVYSIYHFNEVLECWGNLRHLCLAFTQMQRFYLADIGLLKQCQCFFLYHKIMNERLAHSESPEIFTEHFKYLILHQMTYLIEKHQLLAFLSLEGLSMEQRFEANLLLDEYPTAREILQNESFANSAASSNRLFLWPINPDTMQIYIEKSYQYYQALLSQTDTIAIKMRLLEKLIKIADYLHDEAKIQSFTDEMNAMKL